MFSFVPLCHEQYASAKYWFVLAFLLPVYDFSIIIQFLNSDLLSVVIVLNVFLNFLTSNCLSILSKILSTDWASLFGINYFISFIGFLSLKTNKYGPFSHFNPSTKSISQCPTSSLLSISFGLSCFVFPSLFAFILSDSSFYFLLFCCNMPSVIRRFKRCIFVSNRGENTISIFKMDEWVKVQNIGYFSTRWKTPRDFNIVSNGRILVVADQTSNEVLTFKINYKKKRSH